MSAVLPSARAALVDQAGLPTPHFYRFFSALQQAQSGTASGSDITALQAQIKQIAVDLGSPDGSVGNIPPLPENAAPILQALYPLFTHGLLQNGFAQIGWEGNTDDIPEGATNLYFTDARAQASARTVLGRTILTFAFGDASPSTIYIAPNNRMAVMARVVIDTPFNGAGAAIAIGTAAQPELLMPYSGNDPSIANAYDYAPDVNLNSGDAVQLSITPGAGATQGGGRLILDAYER